MCMRKLDETALYEGRHEVKVLILGCEGRGRVGRFHGSATLGLPWLPEMLRVIRMGACTLANRWGL